MLCPQIYNCKILTWELIYFSLSFGGGKEIINRLPSHRSGFLCDMDSELHQINNLCPLSQLYSLSNTACLGQHMSWLANVPPQLACKISAALMRPNYNNMLTLFNSPSAEFYLNSRHYFHFYHWTRTLKSLYSMLPTLFSLL